MRPVHVADNVNPMPDLVPHIDVLVAFATRHGATGGVAERIGARLREAGLVAEVRHVDDVADIPVGCAVVLGSPVYDQSWPPEADAFVRQHRHTLAERDVWLFSVGTFGDRRPMIGPLMTREPRGIDGLREALGALDYRVFAGVIRREQWPLPARMLYHAFGGRFGDNRDWPAIDAWAEEIAGSRAAAPRATVASGTGSANG
jgi:menaquinone-dependent protoporphyrinogen oxidase